MFMGCVQDDALSAMCGSCYDFKDISKLYFGFFGHLGNPIYTCFYFNGLANKQHFIYSALLLCQDILVDRQTVCMSQPWKVV